ncbi:MAG: phosphotransferase [Pseudomonadota bacterium]
MIEGLGIERGALAAYLAPFVPACRDITSVEKFGTGQSNPTYLLRTPNANYVLRSKPPGPLLRSAHLVEREYRVMAALAGTGIPVPEVFHLANDNVSPTGRAFFLMAWLDGRIFWDPVVSELPSGDRGSLYDDMNAVLARLHSLDVGQLGLADFGKPGNYFARQTDRWTRQYTTSASQPLEKMIFLADWLNGAMPEDDGQNALVHGDWRLDNLMIAREAPRVIGVLDWELATLGHPMADLAYQCMQWRLPHVGPMRGLGGVDRAMLGLPSEQEYLASYVSRRGLAGIDNWTFCLVFSFFRLAAILAGVARRAAEGNASNPETARRYGEAVPELARQAYELTQEGAA